MEHGWSGMLTHAWIVNERGVGDRMRKPGED